jgi:hypothetical protein
MYSYVYKWEYQLGVETTILVKSYTKYGVLLAFLHVPSLIVSL